jgi:4'-phosphopantetheinyl transferase
MRLHFRNIPDITREKVLPIKGQHNNEVHIWSHTFHLDDSFLQEAPFTLSQDEQKRAARYHFEKDRKVYESGHVLIRKLLSHYTGIKSSMLQLSPIVNQKPKLENAPFQINFNISHSGNKILVAIGFSSEVGIDVEKVVADFDTDGFAESNYHPNELTHFRSLSGEEDTDYFFRIWTRKEAWLKLTGEGVNDKLRELDFSGEELLFLPTTPEEDLYMSSWNETTDYIATLASFNKFSSSRFFGSELLFTAAMNN